MCLYSSKNFGVFKKVDVDPPRLIKYSDVCLFMIYDFLTMSNSSTYRNTNNIVNVKVTPSTCLLKNCNIIQVEMVSTGFEG